LKGIIMDQRSDLLQLALHWLGTRGLLGLFLAASTTTLRWLLGFFDGTARELALSFGAALFVIAFVAPGLSELLGLRQEGASMCGAILGIVARPLLEALMQIGRALREDARALLRAWIARRWD
jgi:hypothetical protein